MRFFTWAALAAACAFPAWAGSNLRGNGKSLFWRDGKVTLRVSRVVHWSAGETGVDKRETAASVQAAVLEAIRAWVRPGRAKLELDLEFTDTQSVSAGENVVTFTDPAPFDTGVCDKARYIACTLLSFTGDGAIVGASVAFNPYKRHSSLGFEGTHDLGLIMRHEMGHVLGLDHSFLADSVMTTEAEQEPAPGAPRMFAVRRLSEDDSSTLAGLYPLADVPASAITGVVRRGGGPPLAGVRVIAIDAAGRAPHGALTGEGGAYRLLVLPGDFTVMAEPSDGPAAMTARPVSVKEGEARDGVDLSVSNEPKVTVENVGVVQGGFYAGMPRVDLARGRDHSLGLIRSPMGAAVEMLLPEPPIVKTGNPSSPSSAPQLVRQTVRVALDAAVGSYSMLVRSGAAVTVLPAPLRIVPNPRIEAVKDAATGEEAATLRAGRRYAISGTDLAPFEALAAPEFEGAPATSQLAGMSVRVGDRYVPIVSAKPWELVFDMPAGSVTEPGDAKVTVVAGTVMESASVMVKLAPAAE